MSDKPILFSGEMVRAIIEGRKTQTRRVVSPRPPSDWGGISERAALIEHCKYGKIGDRLWVRETWACIGAEHVKPSDIAPGYTVYYAADAIEDNWRVEKWRPSIFMPRWASRISLEIVNIRVEQVVSITDSEAIAEGAQCPGFPASLSNRDAFAKLWDSINSRRGFGWRVNPWVWVIEFRVLPNDMPLGQ